MPEPDDKITIKHAEISIKRFNEVAIPNYLGLLNNHRSNIEKCLALRDWDKLKKEEINATRIIKQVKSLLQEMDLVRNKIQENDVSKFDQMTLKSRQNAIQAIREYLDLQLKTPEKSLSPSSSNYYDDDIENIVSPIQADFQIEEQCLKSHEACLAEFENLHREVEDLYDMFKKFDETVHIQKDDVNVIEENIEVAHVNVIQGESNLRTALKYKKAIYPLAGALLGSCIGGPVGFFVGLKAGGLAAIGCGILGFTGGTVLKKHEDQNKHLEIDVEEKKNE